MILICYCHRYQNNQVAELNLWIVLGLLIVAAILGDGLNYYFGKTIGLLFSFAIIFGVLFAIYIHQWFNINLLHEIKMRLFHYSD